MNAQTSYLYLSIDLKRHRFIREINSLADQSQSPWPHSKNNTHNYLFFFISNTKKRALDLKVRLLDVQQIFLFWTYFTDHETNSNRLDANFCNLLDLLLKWNNNCHDIKLKYLLTNTNYDSSIKLCTSAEAEKIYC